MAPRFVREGVFGSGASIALKIFAQCNGAGIDLFTNSCTTAFSQAFKISVKGQRNVNNALTNLPVFETADELVTFGWAREHALRNRGVAVHDGGYEHISLEGVMSEAFPEYYVARVRSSCEICPVVPVVLGVLLRYNAIMLRNHAS